MAHLTRRETEVVDYIRKEADVFRTAAQPTYLTRDAHQFYLGMAAALDRMAGEILDHEHRTFAKNEPNATERSGGLTTPAFVK